MMMTARESRYANPRLIQTTKRNDTQNAFYKEVSEIDSGLTDSAFSFRLLFSSFSILSSLLRLPFSACFKTLLFFHRPFHCASSNHRLSCCSPFWSFQYLPGIPLSSFCFFGFRAPRSSPFTELNFLSGKFSCCCFIVIFQHLLRLAGRRNLLNHPVTVTFACFDFSFCPLFISFISGRISPILIFNPWSFRSTSSFASFFWF